MSLKAQASEVMKQKIIQTAMDILGSEGYPALTVGRLSKEAGISKGALYHHFRSLDEVRLQVLTTLTEFFLSASDPSHFSSLAEYLDTAGEAMFQAMEDNPALFKALYAFVSQSLFDAALQTRLERLFEHSFNEYKKAFSCFFPDLSEEKMNSVVQILDAYFAGTVIHWFLLKDRDALRKGWRLLADSIIETTGTHS